MVEVLKTLRDDYGVVRLKAEFEAEASRMNELMRLRDIGSRCGLGLLLKLGGAEDISHMFDAMHLGVEGLNAPMVETPFAAKKFFKSLKKYVPADDLEAMEISINIETGTACRNLDAILEENGKNWGVLDSVTVGRVDLTDSMSLTRADINSPTVQKICEDVFSKARTHKLGCGLGGGISTSAIDFVRGLAAKKLIDRYETRKIVFTNINDSKERMDAGILKAVEFETLWLENKKRHYERIYKEDDTRIEMLNKRLRKEIPNSDATC